MAATTQTGRTSNEVAALRARAEEMLATSSVAQRPGYLRTRCEAVRDTLDWITGARVESPATGDVVAPDAGGLRQERMRGEDREGEQRRAGGDSVTPGVAAQVLNWYLRDPYTESPL